MNTGTAMKTKLYRLVILLCINIALIIAMAALPSKAETWRGKIAVYYPDEFMLRIPSAACTVLALNIMYWLACKVKGAIRKRGDKGKIRNGNGVNP